MARKPSSDKKEDTKKDKKDDKKKDDKKDDKKEEKRRKEEDKERERRDKEERERKEREDKKKASVEPPASARKPSTTVSAVALKGSGSDEVRFAILHSPHRPPLITKHRICDRLSSFRCTHALCLHRSASATSRRAQGATSRPCRRLRLTSQCRSPLARPARASRCRDRWEATAPSSRLAPPLCAALLTYASRSSE